MDQDETWHAGRTYPIPWPHCVRWGTTSPPQRDRAFPFSAHICCGHMAGWIKMPLGMEVGLGPGDFLLVGDPGPPFQKGSEPPHFAHVYCGQSAGYIKMPLGMEVGLSPGDFVLDGDLAPLPRRGRNPLPNLRPMSIVAQMAGCITIPLGMAVGLSPGDCVRWGPSPLSKKGRSPPIFGRLLWPNGCVDHDASWHGGSPRPTRDCVRLEIQFPLP